MSSQGDSGNQDEDWSNVTDPKEKRKIQVRLAQRRFRQKNKEKEEEQQREEANQRYAPNHYNPSYLIGDADDRDDSSAPPWGGWPIGYGVQYNRYQGDPSSAQGEATDSNAAQGSAEHADTSGQYAAGDQSSASNQSGNASTTQGA